MERQLAGFHSVGEGVELFQPAQIRNPQYMSFGANVRVFPNSRIFALDQYAGIQMKPSLSVGENTYIGNNCHITITNSVRIGSDILIASCCYISDNLHEYRDPTKPIKNQPLIVAGEVEIGDGSWIGENACIFGDVSVGQHCILGANSVLTKSIPDYSIAVGAPARVIKRYDSETATWRRL